MAANPIVLTRSHKADAFDVEAAGAGAAREKGDACGGVSAKGRNLALRRVMRTCVGFIAAFIAPCSLHFLRHKLHRGRLGTSFVHVEAALGGGAAAMRAFISP